MFRKMRRRDKQLSKEKIIEILKSGEDGVLATIGKENYPYAVPLNYVYHNDSIYFHCAKSGHKIDNINNNAKVSFCVINDIKIIPHDFSTNFKSVILFGTAQELFDEEKKDGLLAFLHKFSSDHLKAGEKYIKNAFNKTKVFKINIEHMTGKGT